MMGSFTAFGDPALLKHKADVIAADVAPLSLSTLCPLCLPSGQA